MKVNDKVIITFLVSMGMFSGISAAKYVSNLSKQQKKALMPVMKMHQSVKYASVISADPKAQDPKSKII